MNYDFRIILRDERFPNDLEMTDVNIDHRIKICLISVSLQVRSAN